MVASSVVYIVEDDQGVRQSLELLLASVKIANRSYSDANTFIREFDNNTPNCVLLDLRMPGVSGMELQETLSNLEYCPSIIFMTGHGDVQTAVRAMKRGAVEFFEKPVKPQILLDTITTTLRRDKRRREEFAKLKEAKTRISTLTPREKDVLELLTMGYSSTRVAEKLNIARNTIENHRSRIMKKLAVSRCNELVELFVTLRCGDGGVPPAS
jgi:FixJ family two-component response regulator